MTTAATEEERHFVVVVLGDVGRSPRMQYHAMSLLELGENVRVSLVGYTGEELIDGLKGRERLDVIRFHIPTPPGLAKLRPLYLIWRILTMSLWLLHALLANVKSKPPVDCILVQNPPALPLLFVALLFTRIKGMTQAKRPRFVIDWHNLGYSMLDNKSFQKVAKAYELYLAPMADGHLTVTKAMQSYLLENTPIHNSISVLYDCPPAMFSPLDSAEQHDIMAKLHSKLSEVIPRSWNVHTLDASQETILTTKSNSNNSVQPRHGRPALVTSSTSWTPDEDFGVLLNALVTLDKTIQKKESSLQVLVVVTGKGPQKALYEEKISQLALTSVAVQTVWLEPGDYPKLLACADLGISLHTSTSGLDLPMKVLDLAGCHVPVCAVQFDCLDELVQDKYNGRTFETELELADQLWHLLSPLTQTPHAASHSFGELATYSSNIMKGRMRWQENWTKNARPIVTSN